MNCNNYINSRNKAKYNRYMAQHDLEYITSLLEFGEEDSIRKCYVFIEEDLEINPAILDDYDMHNIVVLNSMVLNEKDIVLMFHIDDIMEMNYKINHKTN